MAYEFRGNTRARTDTTSGRQSRPSPAPADRPARSPLQAFAALFGAVFLLVGIAGFIPGVTQDYDGLAFNGPESTAELLGLFQVSVLHNIVHLLFGVGLLAAAREPWSRLYLLGGGLGYLAVTVYGAVVDKASDANFLPINSADTLLHLVLGLGMLAAGVIGTRLATARPANR